MIAPASGADVRLGEAEAAELRPRASGLRYFAFCASVPNALIGPQTTEFCTLTIVDVAPSPSRDFTRASPPARRNPALRHRMSSGHRRCRSAPRDAELAQRLSAERRGRGPTRRRKVRAAPGRTRAWCRAPSSCEISSATRQAPCHGHRDWHRVAWRCAIENRMWRGRRVHLRVSTAVASAMPAARRRHPALERRPERAAREPAGDRAGGEDETRRSPSVLMAIWSKPSISP